MSHVLRRRAGDPSGSPLITCSFLELSFDSVRQMLPRFPGFFQFSHLLTLSVPGVGHWQFYRVPGSPGAGHLRSQGHLTHVSSKECFERYVFSIFWYLFTTCKHISELYFIYHKTTWHNYCILHFAFKASLAFFLIQGGVCEFKANSKRIQRGVGEWGREGTWKQLIFFRHLGANSSDSFLVTGDKEVLTASISYSRKETNTNNSFCKASKTIFK